MCAAASPPAGPRVRASAGRSVLRLTALYCWSYPAAAAPAKRQRRSQTKLPSRVGQRKSQHFYDSGWASRSIRAGPRSPLCATPCPLLPLSARYMQLLPTSCQISDRCSLPRARVHCAVRGRHRKLSDFIVERHARWPAAALVRVVGGGPSSRWRPCLRVPCRPAGAD